MCKMIVVGECEFCKKRKIVTEHIKQVGKYTKVFLVCDDCTIKEKDSLKDSEAI